MPMGEHVLTNEVFNFCMINQLVVCVCGGGGCKKQRA